MSRFRLFTAIAAGVLLSAAPALAQPPGPKFPDRGSDKKPEVGGPADAIKQLQAELERMKAMEAEIQAKMKQLQEAAKAAQGANPFGGGGFGGGFGPGFGGFGGGNRGGGGGFGGGFGGLPIERMSAEQIKELIGQLQKVLEEKTRGEKVGEKPGTKPGDKVGGKPAKPGEKPGKPGVKPGAEKPGAASQDEILKRLDKLTAEVEELKRSIKK
jgi:hypothetical protein